MAAIASSGSAAFWLAAMVIFLIVEAVVPGLVSIWFAAGALAALLAALFSAPLWLQLILFLLVTGATLLFTRPLAAKYVNSHTVATNADRLIGKTALVKETINNPQQTGTAAIDGKLWTARAGSDDVEIPEGSIVIVDRIEGVKLIVHRK